MDIDKRIRALELKTKRMDSIKVLVNKVMASGCYGEKNEKLMVDKANMLGDLTDSERKLIDRAFKFRKKEAGEILKELYKILMEIGK